MSEIFISHSSKDKWIAQSLAEQLVKRGYSCFVDFKSIPGGAEWEKEIYGAMNQCTVVVLCATPASLALESRWVFAEIILARALGKILIPLIMQPCDLPTFLSATTQYIDFVNDPEHSIENLCSALEKYNITPMSSWSHDKSPYPGLISFPEEYAPVFFGRKKELEITLNALRPGAQQKRFLAIIGPSGSGKSSFLRAGILPALKRGVIPGSEKWVYIPCFIPSETPFRNLAEKMRVVDNSLGLILDIEKRLKDDGLFHTLLNLRHRDDQQIVLSMDQLEEIERRTPRDQADAFLSELRQALDKPDTPLILLATLRADFAPDFQQIPDLSQLLQRGTQWLDIMDRASLNQAIQEPAKRAGIGFEQGLVEEILIDTRGGDALPLLAHVLNSLWTRVIDQNRRIITRDDYDEIGGVTGALEILADEIYKQTPESDRGALLRALIQLADVNERNEFTRRRVSWNEIPKEALSSIEKFVSARLLIARSDEKEKYIEAAHEALFRKWTLLRQSLEPEVKNLRLRHEIELDAVKWESNGRSDGYLWNQSGRLTSSIQLMESENWPLNDPKRFFLEASKQDSRKRNAGEVDGQAHAIIKDIESGIDPERDILLVQALIEEKTWTPQAEFALNTAIQKSRVRGYYSVEEETENKKKIGIICASFSSDGRFIVSASDDGIARIWNAKDKMQIHVLRGHTSSVNSAFFSPDGQFVVTSSNDKTARIWNVENAEEIISFDVSTAALLNASFSPDGQRIVVASSDGKARIWEMQSGQVILELLGHLDSVQSTVFSSDNSLIATASLDGTAIVWDAITGRKIYQLKGHMDSVRSIAFSHDTTLLVTGSDDKTVRVWNTKTGEEISVLVGHDNSVWSAAFSHNDLYIVSSSQDNTARLWNVHDGTQVLTLSGHTGSVHSAVFSPDGETVLTASNDGSIRLWDIKVKQENMCFNGHKDSVLSAGFSNDGQLIVTSSLDGTAKIWNAEYGEELLCVGSHDAAINSAIFNPQKTRLATASDDGVVQMWDIKNGVKEFDFYGHTTAVRSVAFNYDGTQILTAADDKTARLWDSQNGKEIICIKGHDDSIWSAVFCPDNYRIATASLDGTARIWDLSNGQELLNIKNHTAQVWSIAFDSDGQRIVTASGDSTARIWDAKTGQELLRLGEHNGAVRGAVFSPDGKRIITICDDKYIRMWDIASGKELLRIKGHHDIIWTVAFSPEGYRVITTSDDKTSRIWSVLSGEDLLKFSRTRSFRKLTRIERREYGLSEIIQPATNEN